jgi:hypothetical protein
MRRMTQGPQLLCAAKWYIEKERGEARPEAYKENTSDIWHAEVLI